jgi:hypothetical protein
MSESQVPQDARWLSPEQRIADLECQFAEATEKPRRANEHIAQTHGDRPEERRK